VIPKASSRKDNQRLKTPIPQFNAVLLGNKGTIFSNPGFPEGIPYMSGPQNRYQKWLRQGMVDEETDTERDVQDHFTGRFGAFVVEAYVDFPLSALWSSRYMLDIGLSRYHCGPTLTTKVCMCFSFNSFLILRYVTRKPYQLNCSQGMRCLDESNGSIVSN
jgi:hypothetical protein